VLVTALPLLASPDTFSYAPSFFSCVLRLCGLRVGHGTVGVLPQVAVLLYGRNPRRAKNPRGRHGPPLEARGAQVQEYMGAGAGGVTGYETSLAVTHVAYISLLFDALGLAYDGYGSWMASEVNMTPFLASTHLFVHASALTRSAVVLIIGNIARDALISTYYQRNVGNNKLTRSSTKYHAKLDDTYSFYSLPQFTSFTLFGSQNNSQSTNSREESYPHMSWSYSDGLDSSCPPSLMLPRTEVSRISQPLRRRVSASGAVLCSKKRGFDSRRNFPGKKCHASRRLPSYDSERQIYFDYLT